MGQPLRRQRELRRNCRLKLFLEAEALRPIRGGRTRERRKGAEKIDTARITGFLSNR
jgi:hypothetical protein